MTSWETHPLTPERFEDFADVVNPNRRENHCWCLSHRLGAARIRELGGDGPTPREHAMRAVAAQRTRPGVVTSADGIPVGWCSISPRTAIPKLEASELIMRVDDVDVWSIICLVVRGGHRRKGVVHHMLEGALAHARRHGAPAVEAYPVDPSGTRMDLTMAFVGTRAMFEAAGFEVIAETGAVASRMPRLVMRHTF